MSIINVLCAKSKFIALFVLLLCVCTHSDGQKKPFWSAGKTFLDKTFLGIGDNKRKVFFAPSSSFNSYDGLQLGLAIYNSPAKGSAFQYSVNPMYGFGSGHLVGAGEAMYYFGKKEGGFNHALGMQVRSYNMRQTTDGNHSLRFIRIAPSLLLGIANTDKNQQWVRLQGLGLLEEDFVYNGGAYAGKEWATRGVVRADWFWQRKDENRPFLFKFGAEGASFSYLEASQHYLRLQGEANFRINYGDDTRGVWVRAFAAGFPINSMRDRTTAFGFPVQLVSRANTDYNYDNGYFGRADQDNLWAQQVSSTEGGGFKVPVPASSDDGKSNTAVASLNIKADLPFKFFVKIPAIRFRPYIDIGYFTYTGPTGGDVSPIMVNGGVAIDIGDGAAGIFFPFAGTDNIMNKVGGGYFNKVGFQLDMHKLNPLNRLKKKNGYPVLF